VRAHRPGDFLASGFYQVGRRKSRSDATDNPDDGVGFWTWIVGEGGAGYEQADEKSTQHVPSFHGDWLDSRILLSLCDKESGNC